MPDNADLARQEMKYCKGCGRPCDLSDTEYGGCGADGYHGNCEPSPTPDYDSLPSLEDEREQWKALATEPRLDMLPPEALIASIRYLAERLLDLTDPAAWARRWGGEAEHA